MRNASMKYSTIATTRRHGRAITTQVDVDWASDDTNPEQKCIRCEGVTTGVLQVSHGPEPCCMACAVHMAFNDATTKKGTTTK